MNALLPAQADNTYRGYKVALWTLGLLVALKIVIGTNSMLNTYDVALKADGIPLPSYGAAAASTIVSLFALLGLAHLTMGAIGVIVLVRYRALTSLMFTLLLAQHLVARVIHRLLPMPTTGTPPGRYVNLTMLALLVVGLILSLMTRRPPARET